jgi:hypothetical protein
MLTSYHVSSLTSAATVILYLRLVVWLFSETCLWLTFEPLFEESSLGSQGSFSMSQSSIQTTNKRHSIKRNLLHKNKKESKAIPVTGHGGL